MYEGETDVCARVVCVRKFWNSFMCVNELCVRKLRVKELCVCVCVLERCDEWGWNSCVCKSCVCVWESCEIAVYGCERVVCEKVACKRVACARVACAKVVREKAGLPSDAVKSRAGRSTVARTWTSRPLPRCVPSKAHLPIALAVILGWKPSTGPKHTQLHHPAPPANEVTDDQVETETYSATEVLRKKTYSATEVLRHYQTAQRCKSLWVKASLSIGESQFCPTSTWSTPM